LIILVFVGYITLKRFEEIVVEDNVVAFLAAPGCANDDAILSGELVERGAAGRRARNNHDAADAQRGEELVVIIGGVVGAKDVELVHAVFAAAVANKEKEEGVQRLELLLERRERLLDFRLCGLLVGQDDDAILRKAELLDEGLGRTGSPFLELGFVLGAAGNACQNESAGIGQCRRWNKQHESEQQSKFHAR